MATDVGTLQSKLTLDFSQFSSGMNSAISMVRSLGKQLQKALGSSATQGFSTTNQAINTMQTNITNLQAAVANFQATMNNANTTLAQFSNVQATTSRMAQNLNNAASNMRQVTTNARGAANGVGQVANNASKAGKNAKTLSNHLDTAQKFADNIKRILGGIVVSQAFYKLLGVMQDLVSASVEFMTNMEQSAIAFKYLLGSASNSAGFLEALQDFAITSPMDMSGAESAARMLMTMGFEAESTISVLRTLTDAATVAGGEMSDTVNRIALALGQMLQSGTVKMQEVRQLVNANIPIYDILQEELGLTAAQIANIGEQSVDSGKAVTAILIGLQKRFAGASQEMQTTVTGALSATKDSFYVLFSEVMAGPYESFRQKIVDLSNVIQALAQIARTTGAGGVFETLVPERLQMVIRNVIGALMQLGSAIKFLGLIAKEVFGGMAEIILNVLNVILPPLTIALNAVLQFTYGLLKAYPVIKYFLAALMLLVIIKPIGALFLWFWKVIGLGKIVMTIASYVGTLIKALGALGIVLIHHPMIAVIGAIVIAVGVLTGAFQKAINKIKEFFSLFTGTNKTVNKGMNIGYDPNTILQPTNAETNDSAEKYKQSLEEISSQLGEVGDEANKTSNKLKNAFNQSFDEVYTINPRTSDDLGLSGLENLDLSGALDDLGELNTALEDLGTFDFSDSWSDSFMEEWGKMWDNIKSRIKDYGIPALLAAIGVGALTKNPWAALAAGLVSLFWPELSNAIGLSQEDGNRVLGEVIGAVLGGVIGNLVGGPLGAVLGAAVGYFCGDVMGLIMNGFQTGEWDYTSIGTSLGTGIGAAIGGIVGGPAGALIGAAIGTLVGYIGGALIDGFVNGDWDPQGLSLAIGTGIGAVIGMLVGGPAGAAIGAAIGALVGWITGQLMEVDWAAVGESINTWVTNTGESISTWATNTYNSFSTWVTDTGAAFSTWCSDVGTNIGTWVTNRVTDFENFKTNAGYRIDSWISNTKSSLATWGVETGTNILTWVSGRVNDFNTFKTNAGNTISSWVSNTKSSFATWCNDTILNIANWATNTRTNISNWATQASTSISSWWTNVKAKFDAFKGISFADWCNNTFNILSNWCNNIWTSIKDKIGAAIDKIKEFLGLSGSDANVSVSASVGGSSNGHANGGVFNREHWARFAEGNKTEAIIPLENRTAMQPFVDAVSDGLTASLAPIMSNMNNNNSQQLQPLYVGTLIADERGLKELERKMEVIRLQEGRR